MLHRCFSRFLNCTNSTKSRKESQINILVRHHCRVLVSLLLTLRKYSTLIYCFYCCLWMHQTESHSELCRTSKMELQATNYFCKTLHLRSLTGFSNTSDKLKWYQKDHQWSVSITFLKQVSSYYLLVESELQKHQKKKVKYAQS